MTQIFDWEDTAQVEIELSRPGLETLINKLYAVEDSALNRDQYIAETDRFIQALKDWLSLSGFDLQQPFAKAVFGLLRAATTEGIDAVKRGRVLLTVKELFRILVDTEPTKETGELLTNLGRQIIRMSGNDNLVEQSVNNALKGVPK